jgi:hypothetical protein
MGPLPAHGAHRKRPGTLQLNRGRSHPASGRLRLASYDLQFAAGRLQRACRAPQLACAPRPNPRLQAETADRGSYGAKRWARGAFLPSTGYRHPRTARPLARTARPPPANSAREVRSREADRERPDRSGQRTANDPRAPPAPARRGVKKLRATVRPCRARMAACEPPIRPIAGVCPYNAVRGLHGRSGPSRIVGRFGRKISQGPDRRRVVRRPRPVRARFRAGC